MKTEFVQEAIGVVGDEGRALLAEEAQRDLRVRALNSAERELRSEMDRYEAMDAGERKIFWDCLKLALLRGFAARRFLLERGMTIGVQEDAKGG